MPTMLEEQERFMAEHPIMDAPPGYRLAPEEIAPVDDADADVIAEYGWHICDSEGVSRHVIAELPDGREQEAVVMLAVRDLRAVRIELWRNQGQEDDGRWWVAIRED